MTEGTSIQRVLEAAPVVARPSNPLALTDQSRAIAEVGAALQIARANPRDVVRCIDLVVQDCTRPGLAERALYSYSRGGTDISGPSIRLAEAIAQRWGNFQFGVREIEQRPGESVVQAYAWDVETNTRRETTFTVPHIRDTKRGRVKLEDARDVYEVTANMGARRLRACILGVIPGDVVEAAVEQVEKTLHTKANLTPERVGKMVELFASFGVSREQIEKRIQRRLEALTPALFVQLGKVANSLRDGMSSAADWFELPEAVAPAQNGATKTDVLKDKLRAAAAPKVKTPSVTPKPTREPGDDDDEAPAEPPVLTDQDIDFAGGRR